MIQLTSLILPDDGLFCVGPVLPEDAELPGVGYVRAAEAGGVRLHVRVQILVCGGCGNPLKAVSENGRRLWRCGTPACNRTWHLQIVREPGGPELLALVLKRLG